MEEDVYLELLFTSNLRKYFWTKLHVIACKCDSCVYISQRKRDESITLCTLRSFVDENMSEIV